MPNKPPPWLVISSWAPANAPTNTKSDEDDDAFDIDDDGGVDDHKNSNIGANDKTPPKKGEGIKISQSFEQFPKYSWSQNNDMNDEGW